MDSSSKNLNRGKAGIITVILIIYIYFLSVTWTIDFDSQKEYVSLVTTETRFWGSIIFSIIVYFSTMLIILHDERTFKENL